MVSGVLEPLSPLRPHPCPLLWPQGLSFSSSCTPWLTPHPSAFACVFLVPWWFFPRPYPCLLHQWLLGGGKSLRRTLLWMWKLSFSAVKNVFFLWKSRRSQSAHCLLFSTKFYTKICNSFFQRRECNACGISCLKTLFCSCFCLELIIACLFILLGKWEKFVPGHPELDRRIRLSPQVSHFFLFFFFLDASNLKIFYFILEYSWLTM